MKTKFIGTEINFDELGVFVLNENEAFVTDGGGHYEIIDDVLTYVQD